MPLKGNHDTLGMSLMMNKNLGNRVQLVECIKSTPAARIPKWRTVLKNAFLIRVNDIKTASIDQVREQIKKATSTKEKIITCTFATIDKTAMHPQQGVPILYHDQLNVVDKHLREMKISREENNKRHQKYIKTFHPVISVVKSTKKSAKLTRKLLKTQTD